MGWKNEVKWLKGKLGENKNYKQNWQQSIKNTNNDLVETWSE